jgi:uncharacterized protein (DUF433 family)
VSEEVRTHLPKIVANLLAFAEKQSSERHPASRCESASRNTRAAISWVLGEMWSSLREVPVIMNSAMATTTAKMVFSHITKDPKVRGGKACIDGTRISVKDIVCLHQEGYTPEKMLNVFGTPLTLSQVHSALAYYYDHRDEIEASFADEEKSAAEYERKRAEYLNRRR